jgi:hypothetical protein
MTAMRNALRRLVIALVSMVVIFAAFAAGIGLYAAALALWPFVLVWWPRLLAGAGVVMFPPKQTRWEPVSGLITHAGKFSSASVRDLLITTIRS